MVYRNGKEILPAELLSELQKYVQGEAIYIPKQEPRRAGWGELSGARDSIRSRNREIWSMYREGVSVADLVQRFHLSEDSIKKIIQQFPKQSNCLSK
ncbi:Mor transcription activator family protein [Hydrogenispora ethanolica]|uniref:Mor transcription activator family protein n=1 Tax=Hydrogenispora ethanolica TaxID=1082276 RepID=A0A4R1S732_HYDET|nr:CD3324 family protein [Hydrogenispora ethanolica]TCL75175.1 Mor transcription activator family protein [Hydrogenispora ethanolica]